MFVDTLNTDALWTVSDKVSELQRINQEIYQEIMKETTEFCNQCSVGARSYFQVVGAKSSNPEEVLKHNLATFSEQSEKMLDYVQNVFALCQDAYRKNLYYMNGELASMFKYNPFKMGTSTRSTRANKVVKTSTNQSAKPKSKSKSKTTKSTTKTRKK